MSHLFSHRRVGVLVLTGAAAGLITLAAGPGSASASPDIPYVPGVRSLDIAPDLSWVELNPQPLPPGPPDLSRVELNPQPLPPGPPELSWAELNPQPLPPGPPELKLQQLPRMAF